MFSAQKVVLAITEQSFIIFLNERGCTATWYVEKYSEFLCLGSHVYIYAFIGQSCPKYLWDAQIIFP